MFSKNLALSKLILPFLMIILLSLGGCGTKPNNIQKGTPDSSKATVASVVTYENYLKITLDMTYDDVKSFLGEGKEKAIKADVFRYTWSEQGKNIVIETNKGKVEAKKQLDLGKTTSTLTEKQFHEVTTGMTVDQVVSILGPDYREVSYEKAAAAIVRSLIWMRPDSKFVKVKLQDDKVTDTYNFLK